MSLIVGGKLCSSPLALSVFCISSTRNCHIYVYRPHSSEINLRKELAEVVFTSTKLMTPLTIIPSNSLLCCCVIHTSVLGLVAVLAFGVAILTSGDSVLGAALF